jgi:hypothetical protein
LILSLSFLGATCAAFSQATSSHQLDSVPSLPKMQSTIYHWYAGGNYSGPISNASYVQSRIQVPNGTARPGQFYYALLSIWDSSGSNDQIGFADDYGVWGLTYSYTTGLNPLTCSGMLVHHFDADALNLSPGVEYIFSISVSRGLLTFGVVNGSTQIFDLNILNGAATLNVSPSFCGYLGYSVFEEPFLHGANATPSHDFVFINNFYYRDGLYYRPSWVPFYASAPPKVVVEISGIHHGICKIIN